ncbi:MAG: hypothetical protein IJ220_05475 [Clostridia bacterium]|nr:hypothetical protein [Clostridia bacterium]
MKLKVRKSGISVIGLITLIVIIIIAASLIPKIMRFFGGDKFTNFQKDFEDYASHVEQDFLHRKSRDLTQSDNSKIYYEIANDVSISDDIDFKATGTVNELGLDLNPTQLNGSEFYQILKDSNISGINSNKKFYDSKEKHYVTNQGEVFFLPGYKVEDDGATKWYISASKYYESDDPVRDISGAYISEAKILSNIDTELEAGTNLKKGNKLYITFDATLNGEKLNIEPAVPYEITSNGTYQFKITSSGRAFNKSVTVNNYRQKNPSDILKIGDYIAYTPDSKTYKPNKSDTGDINQTLQTEKKGWRVIYIDKETENFLITTNGSVNSGINFSGAVGFTKGVETLNAICKELYSNNKLNLRARCMTMEDADNIFEQKAPENQPRYAYYPRGTSVSGTIEYEGKTYTKATNEWRTSRFYSFDGGGEEVTDTNGIKIREAKEDNPVYVTQTFYNYRINSKNNAVKNVLGNETCWLASQSVYASSSGAGFGIRTVGLEEINADMVFDSFGNISSKSNAIHPIIEINFTDFSIDLNDKARDGSTINKAWKLVKDE